MILSPWRLSPTTFVKDCHQHTLVVLPEHFQRAAKEAILSLNLFRIDFVAWPPVLIHIILSVCIEAYVGTFKINVKLISPIDRHYKLVLFIHFCLCTQHSTESDVARALGLPQLEKRAVLLFVFAHCYSSDFIFQIWNDG